MIDKVVKIALVILGIAFLTVFYSYSQKDRYQLVTRPTLGVLGIFDTHTGDYYQPPSGHSLNKAGPVQDWLVQRPGKLTQLRGATVSYVDSKTGITVVDLDYTEDVREMVSPKMEGIDLDK